MVVRAIICIYGFSCRYFNSAASNFFAVDAKRAKSISLKDERMNENNPEHYAVGNALPLCLEFAVFLALLEAQGLQNGRGPCQRSQLGLESIALRVNGPVPNHTYQSQMSHHNKNKQRSIPIQWTHLASSGCSLIFFTKVINSFKAWPDINRIINE